MNILPKKSWHVRNKDNIARVRRDEENARLEEEKLAKRAALAEQESRTKLLRDRVKNDFGESSSIESSVSTSLVSYNEPRHINLFTEQETSSGGATTNIEYEAEKKAEQEKKEKALGILKYLGQSTSEDPKPWYLQKNEKKEEQSQDVDKKNKLDPLIKMNSFLDQRKQSRSEKKQRKEKKKHKERVKSKKKTLADLREERLQREKSERLRAEKLIKDKKEGKSNQMEDDPYKDSYYSQYNPDLAKKPKWNKRHHPY
ncbi:leukocyte receptor cluster member 1 homolog [Dendronephthya gigantea]|uniref:leukocyte receptor cluster member 1 homolog n=1 Tax=Dendronephthya gigantea TaxID=151771 RepID=UPI00106DADF9|nr:leukocyte receptor cluster member 1 homolog [Dendronephthya gigantea]